MGDRDIILGCPNFPDEVFLILNAINDVGGGVIFGNGCTADVFNTTLASICSSNGAVRQAILTAICTGSAVSFPNNHIGLKRDGLESKLNGYLLEAPGITDIQRNLCNKLVCEKSPPIKLRKMKSDLSIKLGDSDMNAYLDDDIYGDDFETLAVSPMTSPKKKNKESVDKAKRVLNPTIEEDNSSDDSLDAKITELLHIKAPVTHTHEDNDSIRRRLSASLSLDKEEPCLKGGSPTKRRQSVIDDDAFDLKLSTLFGFKSDSPKLNANPASESSSSEEEEDRNEVEQKENGDGLELYNEFDEDFETDLVAPTASVEGLPSSKPSTSPPSAAAMPESTDAEPSKSSMTESKVSLDGPLEVETAESQAMFASVPKAAVSASVNVLSNPPSTPIQLRNFLANRRPKSAAPRFARATVVSANLFNAIEADAIERKKEALRRPSSARWCSQLSDPLRYASAAQPLAQQAPAPKPHGFPPSSMLKRPNSAYSASAQTSVASAAEDHRKAQAVKKTKCLFFTKEMTILCYTNMLHSLKLDVRRACETINTSVSLWHTKLETALVRSINDLEVKQKEQRRLLFKTTKVSKAHKSLHDFLLSSRNVQGSRTMSPNRPSASPGPGDRGNRGGGLSPESRHPYISYSEAGEVFFSSPAKTSLQNWADGEVEEVIPDNDEFLNYKDDIAFADKDEDEVYLGLAETQRQFSSGPLPCVIERMRLRHSAEMDYVADSIKEPLERLHGIFKKRKEQLNYCLLSTNEMLQHLKRLQLLRSNTSTLNVTVQVREQRGLAQTNRMMHTAASTLRTHYANLAQLFQSGGFDAAAEKLNRYKTQCSKVAFVVESVGEDKNLEKAANCCNMNQWAEKRIKENRPQTRKRRKLAKKLKHKEGVEYVPSDAAAKATTPHTTATRPVSAPIGALKSTSGERQELATVERPIHGQALPHKPSSAPPLRPGTAPLHNAHPSDTRTNVVGYASSTDDDIAEDTGDEYTSDEFENIDVSRTDPSGQSEAFAGHVGLIGQRSEDHFLEVNGNQDCENIWNDLEKCNNSLEQGNRARGIAAEDDILELSADDEYDKTVVAGPLKTGNGNDQGRQLGPSYSDSASDSEEEDYDLFPTALTKSPPPAAGKKQAATARRNKMNWKDSNWNVGVVTKDQVAEHMKTKTKKKKKRPKSSKSIPSTSMSREKEQGLKSDRQRPRSAFQQRNGDVDLLLQSLPTCMQDEPGVPESTVGSDEPRRLLSQSVGVPSFAQRNSGKMRVEDGEVVTGELAQWNMHPCSHCKKSYRGSGKIIPTAFNLNRAVVQSFQSTQTVLQPAKKLTKKEMKELEGQKRVGHTVKMHNYTKPCNAKYEETGFRVRADAAHSANNHSSLRSSVHSSASAAPPHREFCSWKCVKAYSKVHCTVQKRYEIETLVDLAAGYLV